MHCSFNSTFLFLELKRAQEAKSPSDTMENDEQRSQEDPNSPEKDVSDNGFHPLITDSHSKLSGLALMYSRENSGCTKRSSIHYAP